MSKKRKEPLQSSTLLNFFAPDASSTSGTSKNKKRPKTFVDGQRSAVTGTQSTKFEVKEEREDRKWKPQDTDIIVIESDDENEVDAQLVDGSSDVEVVMEARHCKQERSKQLGTEAQANSGGSVSGAGEPSAQKILQECKPDIDIRMTGSASGPLKDEPDEWELAMGDEELDDEFVPNGLLGNSCEDLAPIVGDSEELESVEQGFESCPMCGMAFLDLDSSEAQAHVNACLDAPTPAAPSPSSSSAPKPLGRLSSFFTSAGQSSSTAFSLDSGSKSKPTSAFSVLMSGNADRERSAWAEAQAAEDRNFRPTKVDRRKAPFYKVMTGMPIAVDAFRYGAIPGVKAYFLTHAHSDHYTNLSSSWKNGLIYCSETTANLIVHMLSVDRKWIRSLPMDRAVEVPNTGGVKVTLIDANHCPGSCLFLFEGPQTINAGDSTFKSPFVGTARIFRYLHCGDFRASPQHALHSAVHGRRLDTVYLDTTYLNPKYCFPPQWLVVSACAELARRIVNGESLDGGEKGCASAKGSIQGWMKVEEGKGKQKAQENGNVLVVVGTYSIGKERIVKAIAKVLNTKVYCDARKTAILRCQDDPELHALLTNKPLEAGVHVVPLGQVTSDQFKDYMARWKGRWSRAVAFRPTGWTYSPPAGADPMPPITRVVAAAQARDFTFAHLRPARNSTAQLMQYGVPYSEHSSFAELACFALSIDCARMVATVNVGSAVGRAKMQKWVERWDAERKRRKVAGLPAVVEYRQLDHW